MSWSDNKATLVSGLPSGYRELEGSLEIDEQSKTFNHKSYTIRAGVPSMVYMTSQEQIASDLVIFSVVYVIKDGQTYDTNKDLFDTLHNTIKGLSLFEGMKGYNFRRHPNTNKLCLGTLEFYWGHRTC